jgi:hypothetical protein
MDVARRADSLRQIPAAVRFISAEPLLEPLDALDLTGIDWVIGGGESGAGYRPVDVIRRSAGSGRPRSPPSPRFPRIRHEQSRQQKVRRSNQLEHRVAHDRGDHTVDDLIALFGW